MLVKGLELVVRLDLGFKMICSLLGMVSQWLLKLLEVGDVL